MSSAASPASTAAKRACDACHRRKVKCISDSSKTCKNCKHAGLKCTFNAVPQKKGPKGSRAKVISELRENQRQQQGFPRSTFPFGSPPGSPLFIRSQNPLPAELIEACIDYFFTDVYPTQPILGRGSLQRSVANMHSSAEDYCLITALCAYMMIQPHIVLPADIELGGVALEATSNDKLGTQLLHDALEVRKACSHWENPSTNAVITSFFFFGCYFCLEKHNTAWFHLREATTLAILTGMHQEDTYNTQSAQDATLRRRLFWLLFVTERAYALQTSKPLTLHDTIGLPSIADEPERATELTGFNHLITLFRPFDDTFVGLWNQSIQGCTAEWIQNLQKQLGDALPQYLRSTETQAVDLRTSQQWLRIMIWQMSISQRLLSSNATDEAMTFRFPVELSREFVSDASRFSQQAMDVHGIGLVKKIFDVACTLVDVMTCVPMDQTGFEVGPKDYLQQLMQIMSKLRGGPQRYLPLLLSKTNDVLPRLGMTAIPQALPPLDLYFEEGSVVDASSTGSGPRSVSGIPLDMVSDYGATPDTNREYAELLGTPSYSAVDQMMPYGTSTPIAHYSPSDNGAGG